MPLKVFSIAPTYAVEYLHFSKFERSSRQQFTPPVRKETRQMSKESRKQLMNAIQWLKLFTPLHKVYCKQLKTMVNFKLNFITLTLCAEQTHDDKFIKEHLLEPFLKWMARQGANSYVWKAEAQNNGNIHFHITSNHYLFWKSIRNKWNGLLEKHGYLSVFFKEHGHHDPNSTDVHAVKSDRDIGNYMGKYFGKLENWCKEKSNKIAKEHLDHPSRYIEFSLEQNKLIPVPKRQISGRKWAVSNNLAGLKCFITEAENNYMETTSQFIKAQDFKHLSADFAELWTYPHILESKAPQAIIDKLKYLQSKVRAYDN